MKTYIRTYIAQTKQNWQNVWRDKVFRINFILRLLLLITIMIFTYYFFDYNEDRKGGISLNDWVLQKLPAKDVSIPIKLLMTSAILLFLLRCITNPAMFATFLIGYIFLLSTRLITIYLIQLRAPPELIVLRDPLGDLIYRSRFITEIYIIRGTLPLFVCFICFLLRKWTDIIYYLP